MRKRLLAVAVAALLPALALLSYHEIALRKARHAEVHSEAAVAARHMAAEVDRILEGTRSLIIALSAIPAVNETTPIACSDVIRKVGRTIASLQAILVTDPAGKVLCSTIAPLPDVSLADRDYFKEALAKNDVAVGTYTIGRVTRAHVLPVALAMRRDGKVTGVVVAGLKLEWLQQRLSDRGLVPGGAYTIADRKGTILARNPFPKRFVGTVIPPKYIDLVTAPRPGTIEVHSQDGTERIMGYRPISNATSLYVSAGLSRNEAFAELNKGTTISVATIILGMLLALVVANVVGTTFIIRPIQRIIHTMRQWASGDVAARTRMAGRHGELGLVGAAVDELLDELGRRQEAARGAETAKELVSRELAHRVKNTMAIVQVIAKQTFKRVAESEDFSAFDARLRSLSLAYDLLLSNGGQDGLLGDIVARAIAPHDDPGHPHFKYGGPDVRLPAQASLALSLTIHELATNAAKYGALRAQAGSVVIEWLLRDGRVELSWTELGGPPVSGPVREGFGSLLIRRSFPQEFQPEATFDFRPEGLRFQLRFSMPISPASELPPASDVAGG